MIAELFRYNCSCLFILKPVVGVNWGVLAEDFGMINSYLRDKSREDLEGELLFVLFNSSTEIPSYRCAMLHKVSPG